MATTVEVPIVGGGIEIQFPECCIYCCNPATTHKEIKVKTEHHRDKGGFLRPRTLQVATREANLRIPYCDQHMKAAETVGTLMGICSVIFGIPGALIGLQYARWDPFWLLYIIYPVIGFIAGAVVGMLLFQIVLKPILSIFVKTVRHTPNTFFFSIRRGSLAGGSVGGSAEGTSLGFQAWFPREGNPLMLRFTSSAYATKFVEANPEDEGEEKEEPLSEATLRGEDLSVDEGRIVSILESHLPQTDLFVTPNIPTKKLSNAIRSCEVPPTERILGLIDCTVMGSAKNCLLFGRNGVYFHNARRGKSAGAGAISYSEFPSSEFGPEGSYDIALGNNQYLNISGCSIPTDKILAILASIRDMIVG